MIKGVVRGLKNHKSSGIDNMKAEVLKIVIDKVAPFIFLINKCFITEIRPSAFKEYICFLIYMDGDKPDPCNYWPIDFYKNVYEKFVSYVRNIL